MPDRKRDLKMIVTIKPSKASGNIQAPPSKSMAHRMLICAALANGTSRIRNVAYSEDILATIDCIEAMGAIVKKDNDTVTVSGIGGSKILSPAKFKCRESGSTLRFFIGIAMAIAEESLFYGSEKLLSRPLSVYEDICDRQGIGFTLSDHIHIKGMLKPGDFEVAGNISSQFISGLLFALPLLDKDSHIIFTTAIESASYIQLTLEALSLFGVKASWKDKKTLFIPGSQTYKNGDVFVEGDYSNAAFLDVFNTIGGNVSVSGLREASGQGDKVYKELYERLVSAHCRIDISDCPDLGPVLMVVAAANHGATFTGTERLKIKESDRGHVMCDLLADFGIETVYEDDRIEVKEGVLRNPQKAIDGNNDHRIVMAAATLLSLTGGKLTGAEAVRKSFPDYFDVIKQLGINIKFDA